MNSGYSDNAASDEPTRAMKASPTDDDLLVSAVGEYMTALESGARPSRHVFLARYPEIADELSACLDGLALVHSAAAEIPGAAVSTPRDDGRLSPIDPSMTQPLGDFRLVREIGRGGMGIVYEAIQLTLGRRVAVKVLPFAAALDTRRLERFRNEAQAAAQLHHTNIVPVYSVGCDRSVHFYAMQLIEGQSLSEVIRDLRSLAIAQEVQPAPSGSDEVLSGASRKPSIGPARAFEPPAESDYSAGKLSSLRNSRGSAYSHSVARLALQVAEALDYAHRVGIVHRDIKPANLLLDARGTLWITDFGLAQFYTDHDLTRSGDMVGTMRYMSPEQASGRAVVLDQRTDVYSLGVTLYELLTLERALPGTTHEQLLYQLSYFDPKPARAIDKTIPRELETILIKAMAKDPIDRYPSARAMAEDLRRFLADEPILARPPSGWDQAVKWTRRHKALTRSALVILVLAAISLSISTLLIAREQGRTKTAYELERTKAIEADTQRGRAERASRQARAALDFFSGLAAEEMNKPEFSELRQEMLEESLSYYQSFLDDASEDPSAGAELASARARVQTFLAHFLALDASMQASMRMRLVGEPAVRKELKLTPAQSIAATNLIASMPPLPPEDSSEMRSLSAKERGDRFIARTAQIDSALEKAIGSGGIARLREIERRVRGPVAFTDPDVVEQLQLTRAQRLKIRTLQSQYRNSRFHPGPHRGGEQGRPELREETIAKILALLTPAQIEKWNELKGAPFDTAGLIDPGFGRGHDGPGGEGPGHGPGGRPGAQRNSPEPHDDGHQDGERKNENRAGSNEENGGIKRPPPRP
jgi:serine/threonine protein kinase